MQAKAEGGNGEQRSVQVIRRRGALASAMLGSALLGYGACEIEPRAQESTSTASPAAIVLAESSCDANYFPRVVLRVARHLSAADLFVSLGLDEVRVDLSSVGRGPGAYMDVPVSFRLNAQVARVTPLRVRVGERTVEFPARFSCLSPGNYVMTRHTKQLPPAASFAVLDDADSAALCQPFGGSDWEGLLASWHRHDEATEEADRRAQIYCSYRWRGAGAPDLRPFVHNLPPDWEWETDSAVIGAHAQREGLSEASQAGIEMLSGFTDRRLGLAGTDPDWSGKPGQVHVAVMDTAVRDFDDLQRLDASNHGRMVGLTIQRTACGTSGAPCPLTIHNVLTLPLHLEEEEGGERNFVFDAEHGGFIGTRGNFAQRMRYIVRKWRKNLSEGHLIINASLAWHTKHDCDRPGCGQPLNANLASELRVAGPLSHWRLPQSGGGPLPPSSRLTSRALMTQLGYARCLGALVFAAAGNAIGDDDQDPGLPAGYNRLQIGERYCNRRFGDAVPDIEVDGPLVYAVGALDALGAPLGLTRKRSLPELTAYGLATVVPDPRAQALGRHPYAGPMTGTSIATAVVSGVAARYWARHPRASADDVVKALYSAARPITGRDDVTAELCPNQRDCTEARELTACTAERALHGPDTPCRDERRLPALGRIRRPRSQAEGPVAYDRDVIAPAESEGDAFDVLEAPWVQPQPGSNRCATCFGFPSSGELVFNVADVWDNVAQRRWTSIIGAKYKKGPTNGWSSISNSFVSSGVVYGTLFFSLWPTSNILLNTRHTEGGIEFESTSEILNVGAADSDQLYSQPQ